MSLPLVIITEPIAEAAQVWLKERTRVVESGIGGVGFEESIGQAEGLVVRTYTKVDQVLLDRAPNLKVVGRAGVGLDNIDLDACEARGIRVVHTPHANAMAVVEYTISMLLNTLRPIVPLRVSADDPMTDRRWHAAREAAITPGSVVGSSLGIIGFGHIGSRVGLAGNSLGMHVGYHDLRSIDARDAGGATSGSFEEVLGESSCVSVHVDGRATNRGLIGDEAFGMMREDVVFVNASRGFVVDSEAAARFAESNPRAKLVLDVHDPEPIVTDSGAGARLIGLENVILTPHIAAGTREAKTAMSWVVRDVWAVLEGGDPEHGRV